MIALLGCCFCPSLSDLVLRGVTQITQRLAIKTPRLKEVSANGILRSALRFSENLREANLRMFAQLTPEQWQRPGFHSERGKLTVRDLCRHMAAHDINHIEQVRRILGK